MKSSFIFITFLHTQAVLGGIHKRAGCRADNCLRAVTGTAKGLASQSAAKADCSSFLSHTVAPAVITSTMTTTTTVTYKITRPTTTVTVSTTSASAAAKGKRWVTVNPLAVPSYASACSGAARYSSACSCWGVTPTTTTATTPVTSTTVTTSTITACARPQPTFLIEASGGPADGMFATLVSNGADGYTDGGTDHVVDFTSKADAETFYLNKAGNLVSADKLIANQDSDAEEEPLYFNTVSEDKEGDVYPGPYAPASCAVLGTALTCQDAGSTVLQYCPAEISSLGSPVVLYTSLDPACDPFAFKIVPLCTIIA